MRSGLLLVLIVAGGYLAARLAVGFLARRYLIVAGAEYLLLGILLGPQVSGLLGVSVIDSFGSFITLAIGWTGAVVGARFHLPTLMRVRGPVYQTAFLESLLSFATIGGVLLLVLTRVAGMAVESAIPPATVLAAIGVTTSFSGVAVAARRLARDRTSSAPLLRQLHVTSGMNGAVGVGAFGLLLCLYHAGPPPGIRPPTATEWAVILVGIGVAGGILYHLFLGGERNPDRLFISLAAVITLASGIAAYVRLSPLVPTMLIGAILVNTERGRHEILAVLTRVQRPLYLVLLVFAGAAWRPSAAIWIVPVAAFLVMRPVAKLGAARLATRLSGMSGALGPDWGRGLIGQGSLAVAMGLNYGLYDTSVAANAAFTAAIVSVLFTDFLSARFVHGAVHRHRRRLEGDRPSRPSSAAVPAVREES